MNLFEKNMESFEKRYPLVAEKIKEIDINNIKDLVQEKQTQSGHTILSIKREKEIWDMNSRLDPQIAAELYARRYNIRLYGVYFVFGFSDGRCVRELWKKCDDTNLLVICEPNLKVFAAACRSIDLQDLLENPKIILYFPELEKDSGALLQHLLDYSRMKLLDFCILPGYDILYHEECEMFMDNVLDCMKNAIVNKATHLTFDRDIPRRMLSNTNRMIFSSNLMQLKKALDPKIVQNIPVIIVSAGPSLDKNIHELKKAQGKAFIIAVDASIRTVLQAGVRPDLLCSIDPNSPERFFTGLDTKEIFWACNQLSNPTLLKKYAKHILYYGSFGKRWNNTIKKEVGYDFPSVTSGGSVSTEAFMIALHLGFRKIILIGQDLAFVGGKTHTSGVENAVRKYDEYLKRRHLVEVEGIDGTILQTDYQMWIYKQWFEKAIRINKESIRVIDATEGGARIEGTEIQTLSNVIRTECTQEFSMYNIEKEIPPMFSEEKQQELLKTMKTIRNDIILFENKVEKAIEQEEIILKNVSENGNDTSKVTTELQRLAKENKAIEESDILDYISLYAQNEEYELGDSIYADEDLTPAQLIEKSLALLKGYQKGAKLFLEDFDQIIMNDEDSINN